MDRRLAIGLALVTAGIAALTLVLARVSSTALAVGGFLLLGCGVRRMRPTRSAQPVAGEAAELRHSTAEPEAPKRAAPVPSAAVTPKRTMQVAVPSMPKRRLATSPMRVRTPAEQIAARAPLQRKLAERSFARPTPEAIYASLASRYPTFADAQPKSEEQLREDLRIAAYLRNLGTNTIESGRGGVIEGWIAAELRRRTTGLNGEPVAA